MIYFSGGIGQRNYKDVRNKEKRLTEKRKREYFKNKINEAGSDINKLYIVLDNLTGNKKKNKLPEGIPDIVLANIFFRIL